LEVEFGAYEARRAELEAHHRGKFVVFHGEEFVGAYDTLDAAATEAVRRFGRGPYLIRQVGAPPMVLPASVMLRPALLVLLLAAGATLSGCHALAVAAPMASAIVNGFPQGAVRAWGAAPPTARPTRSPARPYVTCSAIFCD
jgi:hypothetical protein